MFLLESVTIDCPYCGEPSSLEVDCSVPEQRYIEDCQVCCRPIHCHVTVDEQGVPAVTANQEND